MNWCEFEQDLTDVGSATKSIVNSGENREDQLEEKDSSREMTTKQEDVTSNKKEER